MYYFSSIVLALLVQRLTPNSMVQTWKSPCCLMFCGFLSKCRIKQNPLIGRVMKDPNSVACIPYRPKPIQSFSHHDSSNPISQITSQLTALGSTSVGLGLFLRDSRLKHQHRLVQLSTMRTVNPDVLGPQSLLGLNGDSPTMIQVIFGEGSGDGERLDVVSRQIGRIRTLRRSRGRRWRAAALALALALALILGRVRVAVLWDCLTHGSLL